MHLAIFLSINQVCFETGDYVILKMDVEGAEWPGSKAEILQTARFLQIRSWIISPLTRWWLQRFFLFSPLPGEMIQFDDHIFKSVETTN